LGLVIVVAGACMFMPFEQPTVAPPPATPKRIVPRTLDDRHSGFSEQWRTHMQIDLGGGSLRHASTEALAVTNEALYVVGAELTSSDPLKSWQLIALDQNNGARKWNSEKFGAPDSLAIGPNALFVAASFGIDAYDIGSGQRLWTSNQAPPDHEEFHLFYDSGLELVIRKGGDYSYKTLDSQTGRIGPTRTIDGVLVKVDSAFFYVWNDKVLRVEGRNSNLTRWSFPSYYIPDPPLKSGNLLVLPIIQDRLGWHSVVVVDEQTGKKIWECVDCFASDVAVDNGEVYALNRDGALEVRDLNTGTLVSAIKFDGGEPMEPLNTFYGVAAKNGMVFLYFGDTDELIALKS